MRSNSKYFRSAWVTTLVSCASLAFSPQVLAQPPQLSLPSPGTQSTKFVEITDVGLHDGGILMGQVLTTEGRPLAHASVSIQRNGQALAETTTNADGKFSTQGLSGGVYQIAVGNTVATYRLWATGTAPPSARALALLIDGNTVVRGQQSNYWFQSRPWLVTAAVAAAIAVPIAVTNGKSGS